MNIPVNLYRLVVTAQVYSQQRTGKGAFSAGHGEVPIRFVSGSTLVSLFTDPEFPVGSLAL